MAKRDTRKVAEILGDPADERRTLNLSRRWMRVHGGGRRGRQWIGVAGAQGG